MRGVSGSPHTRTAGTTLVVSVAVLGFNLVSGIALARGLGVDGRGQVAALVLWATIAMDLAMIGTDASTTYHVARFGGERSKLIALLRRALPGMFVAGVLAFVFFVVVGGLGATTGAVLVFAVYVPVRMLYEQVLAIVQGDQGFDRYNLGRTVVAAVPAVLFVVASYRGALSVTAAAVGYAIALLVGLLVLSIRRSKPRLDAALLADAVGFTARSYWGYSLRNWFAVLAAKGNSNVDLLILSLLATTEALGLYAVSISAASVLALVGTAAGIVVMPRLAAATDANEAAYIYRRLLTFTVSGTAILAVLLFVTAGAAIPAVFGEGFRDAVPVTRVLAIGYFGVSLAAFAAAVLRGRNRPGIVAIAQSAGGAVTLAIAVSADPTSGFTVAVASTIGFWVSASIQVVAALGTTPVRGCVGTYSPTTLQTEACDEGR